MTIFPRLFRRHSVTGWRFPLNTPSQSRFGAQSDLRILPTSLKYNQFAETSISCPSYSGLQFSYAFPRHNWWRRRSRLFLYFSSICHFWNFTFSLIFFCPVLLFFIFFVPLNLPLSLYFWSIYYYYYFFLPRFSRFSLSPIRIFTQIFRFTPIFVEPRSYFLLNRIPF